MNLHTSLQKKDVSEKLYFLLVTDDTYSPWDLLGMRDLPDPLALKDITYDEHDLLHGRYSEQHTLLWQI